MIKFYSREIIEIVVSVILISLAFSIGFMKAFPIILFTVGLGFVLHEMGHKFVAQRFGCIAMYRMWIEGLIFAIFIALITNGHFVFAAPGAVYIYKEHLSRREDGLISLAGPITNFLLALAFLYLVPYEVLSEFGFRVNVFLGLFNLLPIPPLDGSKILAWSLPVWLIAFGAGIGLFLL